MVLTSGSQVKAGGSQNTRPARRCPGPLVPSASVAQVVGEGLTSGQFMLEVTLLGTR